MVGMAIAILTNGQARSSNRPLGSARTGARPGLLFQAALIVGGAIGLLVAARVEMTKMPELIAAMHSLIGLAAVCIAYAVVSEPSAFGLVDPENAIPGFLPYGNRVELFIGTFVGAITFSGSADCIRQAVRQVQVPLVPGRTRTAPGAAPDQPVPRARCSASGVIFFLTQSWLPFIIMTLIAFVLGVLIIIPIGGADMPVVVSMLNSYSAGRGGDRLRRTIRC